MGRLVVDNLKFEQALPAFFSNERISVQKTALRKFQGNTQGNRVDHSILDNAIYHGQCDVVDNQRYQGRERPQFLAKRLNDR
jgi:hypothetical protein